MKTKTTYLSIFKLIMITSAFVLSIRNMPMLAETGMQMFFYIIVAAIIYLIPVGLVSAELATGWPKEGGVYVWIKEAFGEKWAFFSMWMLWVQMFFGMVMITSFIAAMWAYVFYPPWAKNETFIFIMILVMYWGVTLLNLKGLKAASLISTIGVVFGVFIPAALILVLGAIYLFQGNPVNMDFAFTAKNGDLPPWWQKENKYGVPTHIIFTQATAISIVALLYLVVPSINSVFFMILILTTLLYSIMYIFMFAAGIKLRYSQPDVPRAYKIPGKKNIGMWILAGFGVIAMAFVVVISFFPPEIVSSKGNSSFYVWFMAIGLAFFVIIPLIVFKFKKPEWKKENAS